MREAAAQRFLTSVAGILDADAEDLWTLARAGGLDPRQDFRYADLRSLDCRGEDLTGFDLTGADLSDTDLTGANLAGVSLAQAKLARTNLTQANLQRAVLLEAELSDACFRSANLRMADLRGADRTAADFAGADLRDALGDEGVLIDAPAHLGTSAPDLAVAGAYGSARDRAYAAEAYRARAADRTGASETKPGPLPLAGFVGLAIGAVVGVLLSVLRRRAEIPALEPENIPDPGELFEGAHAQLGEPAALPEASAEEASAAPQAVEAGRAASAQP